MSPTQASPAIPAPPATASRSCRTEWSARPRPAARLAVGLVLAVAVPARAIDPEPGTPAARIAADVASLAGFGTRHTFSEQNNAAAEWLADQFREAGCDEVSFHDFTINRRTRRNVEATIQGSTLPDELILVGAHFDSRNERASDNKGPAPGAVDNASGTAALLEIARALAAERPGRSVRFVAFSGEEQGLVGSRSYADMIRETGINIILMINLDMIGHPMDKARRVVIVDRDQGLRDPGNDAASAAWAERFEHHVRAAGLVPVPGPMVGSDYIPFEAIGVPCVGLFDGADQAPFYHDADDSPDKVDPDYCAAAAGAALALVREAADPRTIIRRAAPIGEASP